MKRSRSLLLSGLTLSLALSAPLASAKDMVISIWDGYMAPNALLKFQQASGIKADQSLHATNEEIMGKIMASGGEGYDVLFVSSPFAEILKQQGLLADIDPAKIPNLKNLYPEAQQLEYDPGNTFSVPYTWGTTGICYRADQIKTEPSSWKELLQPSDTLKGKVTMLATDRWLLGAGFLSNGWSVNESNEDNSKIGRAHV